MGPAIGFSEQAWHHKIFRQLALDKLVYYPVRERFGLSAQMAVRAIAMVDAYALDKRSIVGVFGAVSRMRFAVILGAEASQCRAYGVGRVELRISPWELTLDPAWPYGLRLPG
jgi:hypothetical protein